MKHVRKSVLLWYSAHEMFALVTDVAAYPRFLPWCDRVDVLARDETSVTARLSLHYAGVRHAFTTRNTEVGDTSVEIALIDGPFSVLDGTWRFQALPSGAAAQASKVELDLRYAFAGAALELVISPVFDRIANTLVDSFVRRAQQVYGPR